MGVTTSQLVLLGTNETTGITIANNATSTSSETDCLASSTAEGWAFIYQKFTSTVAVGSMDTKLYPSRVTGQAYSATAPIISSTTPINGTQNVYPFYQQIDRYNTGAVTNNATGANITNVLLAINVFIES